MITFFSFYFYNFLLFSFFGFRGGGRGVITFPAVHTYTGYIVHLGMYESVYVYVQ